ncbi:maleylpyruvate isomerase family mycothiol-dependent enzyme [Jatrophihabitans sp. YIM 134969]
MTTLADRTIEAMRVEHDALVEVVGRLDDDQLTEPSGASRWSVADVLSHLGSGAQITLAGMEATLRGGAAPDGFNQSVWDRWNAMSPRDQADGFVAADAALVSRFEALDADQRDNVRLPFRRLPEPITMTTFAGMRLDELTLHAWDVRVALDPHATVAPDSATVVLEHLSGGMAFLLGLLGTAEALAEPVSLEVAGTGLTLVATDTVALVAAPTATTATFTGGPDAALRLLTGRLDPTHTPSTVTVTGNTTLEAVRTVFPGF